MTQTGGQERRWRPNWRNAKEYPRSIVSASEKESGVEDLPPLCWAWEFIRRNPKYQALFDRVVAETHPEGYPVEREGALSLVDADDVPSLQEAFGISHLFPPSVDRPTLLPTSRVHRLSIIHGANDDVVIHLKSQEVLVKYDLSRPIGPQLKQAKELLQAKVRTANPLVKDPYFIGVCEVEPVPQRFPKSQRERWPELLRVLDAMAEGASNDEIAEHLLDIEIYPPGTREADAQVDNMKQAAKTMVKSGFKKLLDL